MCRAMLPRIQHQVALGGNAAFQILTWQTREHWHGNANICTHIYRYICVYMCILFTCFYVCIDMWKEASETPSETPSFPVFPSLFFFFLKPFLQNTEQMLRREGWLKEDVPKEQKTAAVCACTFLVGCHQDLKDPWGAWWEVTLGQQLTCWGQTVGMGLSLGSVLWEGSLSLLSTQTWRGTIWHLTGHQGHSTPFANIMLSH